MKSALKDLHHMLNKILFVLFVLGVNFAYATEILNGDFEKLPEKKVKKGIILKLADNWSVFLHSGEKKVAGELTNEAYSGKNAIKLTAKEEKAFVGVYQTFDCKPDTELKITSWMKRG